MYLHWIIFVGWDISKVQLFRCIVVNTLFRENFCMKELRYNGLCANSEMYILNSFVIQFIWLQNVSFSILNFLIIL